MYSAFLKRYAWQVQVSDLSGKEGFQNNGFSEVNSFKYGDKACPAPTGLRHSIIDEESASARESLSDGDVVLEWNETPDAQAYELKISTQGDASTGSATADKVVRLTETKYLLVQSKRAQPYNYALRTICDATSSSTWSTTNTFELKENAWFADSNLTYVKTNSGMADPTPTPVEKVFTDDDSTSSSTDSTTTSTDDNEETTDSTTSSTSSDAEETPEENLDDILNTPLKIFIPAEGEELPESLQNPLPVLPANPTIEQLQSVLKTKKPTCTGITASYVCGNHERVAAPFVPQYSGSIVSVATGDEIAMNSMVISVINIDGSGNGEGLIKVQMLKNAKLGVTLSGIQVAEGGCIVAGKAELSGVDVALLNDKQRANLAIAYQAFEKLTDLAIENADAIAETYNSFVDVLEGAKKKAIEMAAKIASGGEPTKAEIDLLKKLNEQATATMEASLAAMKKQFGDQVNSEMTNKITIEIAQNKLNTAALTAFRPNEPLPPAIQASVASIAATKPADTVKTIKRNPKLQIGYADLAEKKQKSADGGTISISPKLLRNTFWPIGVDKNAEVSWVLKDKDGANLVSQSTTTGSTTIDFNQNDPVRGKIYNIDGMVLVISDGTRSISVNIKIQKLELTGIAVVDAKHPTRGATNGQTLYLVGEGIVATSVAAKGFGVNFTHPDLNWEITNATTGVKLANTSKESKLSRDFGRNPMGTDISKYLIEVNGPDGVPKNVKVEVVDVDGDKQKGQINLENFGKDVKKFTEITKTTDEQLAKLEKIGFFRRVKDKFVYESEDKRTSRKINVLFNVIPVEVTYENKEDIKSPLYYRERKFSSGFEAGLKAEFKHLLIGLPIKEGAKKIGAPDNVIDWIDRNVKAEVNAKIKADTKAEVKVVQESRKMVGSDVYTDLPAKIDPAAISLSAEIGVEAEISVLKDASTLFSFGGFASGMAKAEIITLGYTNSRWDIITLRKGIFVEVTAGAYVIFAGYKHELDPYYRKIMIVDAKP